jgi:acyl dehydratase
MKLPASLVGTGAGPLTHDIDARWLMAYAAALGETAPAAFDTDRAGGPVAHPLFPVCYEWPLAVEMRARMPEDVVVRSVHATHDLRLHRRPRAGDRLVTRARVVRVEPRRSGAFVLTRFETSDTTGAPVSVTDYGSIYLGVDCDAAGDAVDTEPAVAPPLAWSETVAVAATLAHVYTECARIWNPIHTDRAVARRAGLPDIILHGTATLALAVSAALARGGPEAEATRIRARFGAMVPMPSTLTLAGSAATDTPEGPVIAFQARSVDERPAVRDGMMWLARPAAAQRGRP